MWSLLSLGGRARTVVAAVVVVGLLGGGAFAAGVVGVPSVAGVENSFGPVNETTTVIETNLTVSNPNPIGASLGGLTVDYDVLMNDVSLASGSKAGVSVGSGNSTLNFTTAADNGQIPPWWVSHVRNDEQTTVTVDTAVTSGTLGRTIDPPNVTRQVETDLLSQFNSTETREVDANRALVSDPVLYINETSAQWGDVTNSRTGMDLTFVVYNPKSYPIAVSELGYNITMNEVAVGEGSTESEYVVPPKSTETIEATVYINNENIDDWWVTHLERNQVTDLKIDFDARLNLADTTVDVPLNSLTYTTEIETDIFGTKPTDGETGEDATQGEDDDDAESTTTGSPGDSETETETETSSPTATPTETGDGSETATSGDETTTDGETTTDDGGLLDLG
ncbi:LEA type 2 family protein [Halobellus captivus]|uniref:LEA type 2 family protein n=1 Tax=Halobellus captivus TaxID=2592614 RepID=UPI0011A2D04C|nr:LEA type 2 family protein [Halobellus captivus]